MAERKKESKLTVLAEKGLGFLGVTVLGKNNVATTKPYTLARLVMNSARVREDGAFNVQIAYNPDGKSRIGCPFFPELYVFPKFVSEKKARAEYDELS